MGPEGNDRIEVAFGSGEVSVLDKSADKGEMELEIVSGRARRLGRIEQEMEEIQASFGSERRVGEDEVGDVGIVVE